MLDTPSQLIKETVEHGYDDFAAKMADAMLHVEKKTFARKQVTWT